MAGIRSQGRFAAQGCDALLEVGRRAVQLATAPLLWEARTGLLAPTAEIVASDGISRQALAKAIRAGRLVSLPAGRTRLFPLWQFQLGHNPGIRPEAAQILAAFIDSLPDIGASTVCARYSQFVANPNRRPTVQIELNQRCYADPAAVEARELPLPLDGPRAQEASERLERVFARALRAGE